MALSRVVSEIFIVEKCGDLEIRVRGHSRSLKVIPFDRLGMIFFFLLVFYSNFVPKTGPRSLNWVEMFLRYLTSKMP